MTLGKYSFGTGDRFGQQGEAQLRAFVEVRRLGVDVTPVWNKSRREHTIIGTSPADVRREADAAVAALGWENSYFVDADHIGLANVDSFVESSDFFTLDVADFVGKPPEPAAAREFIARNGRHLGDLSIPGVGRGVRVTTADLEAIAAKYLSAVREAGRLYRRLASAKRAGSFVTEVSMDETDEPQTPVELLFILEALAAESVPVQTLAPKFSGRFNKGVEYLGEVEQFAREFEGDVCALALAVCEFGLPTELKLSVHSGSDKFSLYPLMRAAISKHHAGLHLKTAGTTWLEELIGLAEAGGDGLSLVKEVYRGAFERFDEVAAPYAAVIDIERERLPSPVEVDAWDGRRFAAALRHDTACEHYSPHVRQLLHIGYKVAAELGARFQDALHAYADTLSRNVTANLLERHLRPLFVE